MKRIEKNRLYMIQAVNKVAKSYETVWTPYADFGDLFGKLNAYESSMLQLMQRKQSLLQPFSGIKQELRNDFALTMGKLAAFLLRIGRAQNDQALIVAASFTVAQFERYNAQKALVTAESILAFAEQYATELSANSYASEILTKAKEQLEIFIDKGLIPAERRTKLSETTVAIQRLSADIMDFLKNELDVMMRLFVDVDPDFHLAYENARVIPKTVGAYRVDSNEGGKDPNSANDEDGAGSISAAS